VQQCTIKPKHSLYHHQFPSICFISEYYDEDVISSKVRASILVSRETKLLIAAISRNQKTSLSAAANLLLIDGLNVMTGFVEEVGISKEIEDAARGGGPVPWDKAEKLLTKNVHLEPHPLLGDLLSFVRAGRPGSREVIH